MKKNRFLNKFLEKKKLNLSLYKIIIFENNYIFITNIILFYLLFLKIINNKLIIIEETLNIYI